MSSLKEVSMSAFANERLQVVGNDSASSQRVWSSTYPDRLHEKNRQQGTNNYTQCILMKHRDLQQSCVISHKAVASVQFQRLVNVDMVGG